MTIKTIPCTGYFYLRKIISILPKAFGFNVFSVYILSMTKYFTVIGFILGFSLSCFGQDFLRLDSVNKKSQLEILRISDSLGLVGKPKLPTQMTTQDTLGLLINSIGNDSLQKNIRGLEEKYRNLKLDEKEELFKKLNGNDSLISTFLKLQNGDFLDLKSLDLPSMPPALNWDSGEELMEKFLPDTGKEFRELKGADVLDLNQLVTQDQTLDAEFQNYHAISKRVLSLKDREILDSARTLIADKLYRVKESAQDSLSVYLIAEKEKIKDNLFFEGLINVQQEYDKFSVSDFSGSVGLRLNKLYEIGAGPEFGVFNGDFSALGARLFARREVLEKRLFAVVENSVGRGRDLPREGVDPNEMVSNWKIGTSTLFNLSPTGNTKLNLQTLLNPQYLKGGYSNLIDLRFGISKLSINK